MQTEINTIPIVNIKQRLQDYRELMKPGITTMVVLTALAGFYLGSAGQLDLPLLIHTLIGTGLVAGGGGALNNYLERDADARMHRTKNRPLPAGRMSPNHVLIFGSLISLLGLIYLAVGVNGITTLLAGISWISYVLIYTPLKRISPLATLVGAIPGALPPMGGWTAATGEIAFGGWILFTLLFMWQLPHFLSIAWLCKEDYARGGFPMLTVLKDSKNLTGRQMMLYSAALLVVSLVPAVTGMAGVVYLIGAFTAGIIFLALNVLVARSSTQLAARRVLWASILYLPFVLILLMVDKAVV